jgi:hypothetical protein
MGKTKPEIEQLVNEPDVLARELKDHGVFPNRIYLNWTRSMAQVDHC